jgi:hypothetical protein
MLAVAAHAQFQLLLVRGGMEVQVAPVFDFGSVTSGDSAAVQFRVRNVSSAPATLGALTLSGAGFSIPSAPVLPRAFDTQASLDFSVAFQADASGSYRANLSLPGNAVTLTATVVPGLLYRAASPIDFGPVPVGAGGVVHVAVENHSGLTLPFPGLVIGGAAFSLANVPASGTSVLPQQSTGFDVRFVPPAAGSYSGSLSAGGRAFLLLGTSFVAPPPTPTLSVDPPQSAGDLQPTLRITFGSVAVAATGTATLDFHGPDDPTIAFAGGGRTISFQIPAGQPPPVTAPFQIGTTSGTLIVTVTIGGVTTTQSLAIAPAAVVLNQVQASRSGSGFTIDLTGYDNTRTAGVLEFNFYDPAGKLIPPSPIQASADFAGFFQTSSLGGQFRLQAVFPVNGDPSQIAAFEAKVTNAMGVVTTGKTGF